MVIQLKKGSLGDVLSQLSGSIGGLTEQYQKRRQNDLIQNILNQSGGQVGQQMIHPGETPGMDIEGPSMQGQAPSSQQIQALSLVNPQLANVLESQRKTTEKTQQGVRDRNIKVFDDVNKSIIGAEDELLGLNQLAKLSESIGKKQTQDPTSRFFRSFRFDPETGGFTRIGKATATPEEERFVKLIADQTKTIKNDYGARITNLDMEVFLRRFPDLMMTGQGRKDILDTLRDYREGKLLYNKAIKQQLRATKGNVDPYTLDEIVEQKIGPQLEKIKTRVENRGFGKGEIEESMTVSETESPGRPISREIAVKIFEEVGGDVKKAEQRARELGYQL